MHGLSAVDQVDARGFDSIIIKLRALEGRTGVQRYLAWSNGSVVMKTRFTCVVLMLLLAVSPAALAGEHQGWKTTSDIGVGALLMASLAVPATRNDWQGFREAAYSNGLGEGMALLGKSLVHEERPNHRDNKSFPSSHATLAFAAATTMYRRYGWQYGFPAYAIASLTGVARVEAREHHWWDVAAGAAFGIGSGWLVTHPINDRVQMVPWIGDKGGGIAMTVTF